MTIKEIAGLAKVSTATVSLVLNEKKGVSPEKREEIHKLLEHYDYKQQRKSHPVVRKASKNLLFLKILKSGYFVEQNAGFISKIMDAVQEECSKNNYTLTIAVEGKDFSQKLATINEGVFDGIFVIGTELEPEDFHYLDILTKPYIVIDNSMPNYSCNSITMDNEEMVFTILKHLSELHNDDFGYLHGNQAVINFEERKKSVLKNALELGFKISSDRILVLDASANGSYESMKAIIKNGTRIPHILFADNDILAIGAMKALLEAGYNIPGDIKIAGFDDIYLSPIAAVPLTTIHVQRQIIGKMATIILLNHIVQRFSSSVKIRIGGLLKIRNSTAG
jgi:DNA-binding LacI/PurR family transcriptional regulator